MGRRLPYSQVVPDSEDEDELVVDSTHSIGTRTEVPSTQLSATSAPTSPSMEERHLSQPQIAVLAEASEVPVSVLPPRRPPPVGASIVPTSLLRGPSLSTIDTATTSTSRVKPRPRPRPKALNPDVTDNQAATSSISNPTPLVRNTAPSSPSDPIAQSSSIPGLNYGKESDPVEPYTPDIAERAKLRSRVASSKAQGKRPAGAEPDVIELSSDSDDELSLLPPKKPQGKDKEIAAQKPPRKRAKSAHESEIPDPPLNTLPVATSKPNTAPDSSLPPSDPPLPSTSTAPLRSDPRAQPASGAMVPDVSPASPPPPQPSRKRKRPSPSSPLDDGGKDNLEQEPAPPPFFAGSSSSAPAPSAPPETHALSPLTSPEPVKTLVKGRGRKRKATQSDGDSDWDGGDSVVSKPKAKPRARKRKAAQEDEDEWDGDEPAAPEPEPKPKRKANRKKKAEVVIEVSTRSRRNTASVSPAKGAAELIPAPSPSPSPTKDPSRGRDDKTGQDVGNSKHNSRSKTNRSNSRKDTADTGSNLTSKVKGKKRAIASSEEDDSPLSELDDSESLRQGRTNDFGSRDSPTPLSKKVSEKDETSVDEKESASSSKRAESRSKHTPSSSALRGSSVAASSHLYRLPRRDSRGISEILRKVGSQPGSPFASSRPHTPLAKMSRSTFRNIVPLHQNLRAPPPPPPPRPPPPKKSKKQLEREEKWEMELEDTVEGWYCLTEEERAQLRRAKINAEMGYDD